MLHELWQCKSGHAVCLEFSDGFSVGHRVSEELELACGANGRKVITEFIIAR